MEKLEINPEFMSLIPPLSGEEFRQLTENIKAEGCRDALVVWQGTLVDGHNRYRICQENGIPFTTEEKEFADIDEAIHWIILNQFGRRNLSPAQRSELAMKLEPAIRKQAKENQKKSGGAVPQKSAEPVETRKELAKIAGVSHDTIRKTEKILNEGTPEQIERARKGGKGNSVNAIYKEVKGIKDTPKVPDESPKKPRGRTYRDEWGRLKVLPPELADVTSIAESVQQSRDPNAAVVRTIDSVIMEFQGNLQRSLFALNGILERNEDLLKDKENNEKIMTVLSEAETAIHSMKGKYSYE